jgi:transcription initiation factor IIF auxiliary subunit
MSVLIKIITFFLQIQKKKHTTHTHTHMLHAHSTQHTMHTPIYAHMHTHAHNTHRHHAHSMHTPRMHTPRTSTRACTHRTRTHHTCKKNKKIEGQKRVINSIFIFRSWSCCLSQTHLLNSKGRVQLHGGAADWWSCCSRVGLVEPEPSQTRP